MTSTVSAASRAASSLPRSADPRRASAASISLRTAFAMAPTRGRSSAVRAPMPRRTPVRRPFLPRTSSSSASTVAPSAPPRWRRACRPGAPRDRGSGRRGPRSSLDAGDGPLLGSGPGIANPRASVTSRARRAVVRGRSGAGSGALGRLRRSGRTSRCRGRRGRPGSCDRCSISARFRPLMNWP